MYIIGLHFKVEDFFFQFLSNDTAKTKLNVGIFVLWKFVKNSNRHAPFHPLDQCESTCMYKTKLSVKGPP